jgi:hypothetical protein
MSVRVRLLVFAGVPLVLIGLLASAGVLWWRWDTGRQPKVADDIPVMDRAIADTVVAAGDQAAVAISGVFRATTCDLGVLREGGQCNRSADLYTEPGGEDALIGRIAAGLPAAYQASRGTPVGGNAAPLSATAGQRVQLSVRQLGEGWVTARATTGCTGGRQPRAGAGDSSAGPAAGTINRLFAALGTGPAHVAQHTVACPAGGNLVTTAVVSRPAESTDLGSRLAPLLPAGARRFASPANRVSYRAGAVSVTVSASDDSTAVTARYTSGC